MASPTTDDGQQVRGKGARDRGASRGGNSSGGGTATARGGDRSDDGRRTTATRRDDERGSAPERVAVRRHRADTNTNIYIGSSYRGPRYYAPVHYDRWARHYYNWSPIGYAPWSLIYGSIGFSNFGFYGGVGGPNPFFGNYGYGYGGYAYPGPYSPWHASGYDIGAVRLKIRPRDAQVFVDGYYAGLVDDFDGTFQSLRLEQGGHKIEVRMPGFEDLEIDVHVQPGRTITLTETLRQRP